MTTANSSMRANGFAHTNATSHDKSTLSAFTVLIDSISIRTRGVFVHRNVSSKRHSWQISAYKRHSGAHCYWQWPGSTNSARSSFLSLFRRKSRQQIEIELWHLKHKHESWWERSRDLCPPVLWQKKIPIITSHREYSVKLRWWQSRTYTKSWKNDREEQQIFAINEKTGFHYSKNRRHAATTSTIIIANGYRMPSSSPAVDRRDFVFWRIWSASAEKSISIGHAPRADDTRQRLLCEAVGALCIRKCKIPSRILNEAYERHYADFTFAHFRPASESKSIAECRSTSRPYVTTFCIYVAFWFGICCHFYPNISKTVHRKYIRKVAVNETKVNWRRQPLTTKRHTLCVHASCMCVYTVHHKPVCTGLPPPLFCPTKTKIVKKIIL